MEIYASLLEFSFVYVVKNPASTSHSCFSSLPPWQSLAYFTSPPVSADIGSPSAADELEKCVFSDLCYLTDPLYEWWHAASPYSPEQKPKYGPAVHWRLHLLVRGISKGSCLLCGVSVDAAWTVYHGQIWKDCHWSKGAWNKHLLTTCTSCINHSLCSCGGLP